jgi:hypothetical protein
MVATEKTAMIRTAIPAKGRFEAMAKFLLSINAPYRRIIAT